MIADIEEMIDSAKDVTWLAANYGNKDLEKIGPLGTAGLISAQILESVINNWK